jgi:uncharacterized protein YjbI with pentapeptide repeats
VTRCRKSHDAAIPQLGVSATASDALVLDEVDASNQWMGGARVLELELDRPEWVDLRFEECDLSGVVARDFVMRRVQFRATRLRGVAFTNGQYDDGLLLDCKTDELSLRFTRLRNVTFRGCDLSNADFYSATFEHVTIESCSLRGARFHSADVKCLRIKDCDMLGIAGALDLKGAVIDFADLPSLAPSLAGEAGIELVD